MELQSSAALMEALAQSSGEIWYTLITVTHPSLTVPLRLASPATSNVISNGNSFLPTRINIVISGESFDSPSRAEVELDNVDGVILQALQSIDTNQTLAFDVEVVTESEPDLVQQALPGLEISRLQVRGVQSLSIELSSESVRAAPFPSLRMTRERVPGIYPRV